MGKYSVPHVREEVGSQERGSGIADEFLVIGDWLSVFSEQSWQGRTRAYSLQ